MVFCKICSKKLEPTKSAKGFCKKHYEQYRRKSITIDGILKNGFYFDKNFNIQKEKDTLRKTIIESNWFRKWYKEIKNRDENKCQECSKRNCKLIVHHEKIRMSFILKECKEKFNNIRDQLIYAEKLHTIEIGITLCLKCHAEKHKNEKIYSLLNGVSLNSYCKLCNNETYCKNFCKLHYSRYKKGIYDLDGNQIREMKSKNKKEKILKKEKLIKKCKICDKKYYGLGFCLTHYNRFKIGQIDESGKDLRSLGQFTIKGMRQPKIFISLKGENKSLEEWSKIIGISKNALNKRINRWGIEKALTKPITSRYRKNE